MESFWLSIDGFGCLVPLGSGIVLILHTSSNPADGFLLSVSLLRSVKERAGLQGAGLSFDDEFIVQMAQTHDG